MSRAIIEVGTKFMKFVLNPRMKLFTIVFLGFGGYQSVVKGRMESDGAATMLRQMFLIACLLRRAAAQQH